jgi:hypothetical protein
MTRSLAAVPAGAIFLGLLWLSACSAPSRPVTVEIRNLTRPGATEFYAGEKFEVLVTGSPNQTVACTATQNSSPASTSTYGRTGAEGRFTLSGTMGSQHLGSWREIWRVGKAAAPPINFSVSQPPSSRFDRQPRPALS